MPIDILAGITMRVYNWPGLSSDRKRARVDGFQIQSQHQSLHAVKARRDRLQSMHFLTGHSKCCRGPDP